MNAELHDAWRRFRDNEEAFVLVLTGAGGSFCAGWDLADAAEWLDFTRTMAPMLAGDTLTAEQWAQFGTSTGAWVLVPLVIGVVRVLRAEVT
jgi:enoyl-CoA hydratase/carnithine racemase